MSHDHASLESPPTGWGILATGRIARGFAGNLREVPGARVAAVGSRSSGSGEAFALEYGDDATRVHASYAALVDDPCVDVVYVASPHALHLEHARLALEAGKPVLCEKPLTLNAAEGEQMVALARERGLFLMEAMWTACHPMIRAVLDELRSGRRGTPKQVHADLGFVVEAAADDRMVDPSLGASALLDMGIYPLTFAHLMLGPVVEARGVARLSERGVDHDVAVATRHAAGGVAALTASMTSHSPRAASIATDTGRIDLPQPFHHPPYAVWTATDGSTERIEADAPVLGSGLGNEAAHVMSCLAEGRLESPWVPHEQTLALLRVMDTVREQIGVRFAADP